MPDLLKPKNIARYPRLDTVLMVEKFIKDHSGEYKIYQLWKNLPKKVMYQTYKVIVSYLIEINRVAIDSEGKIGYIWSPEVGQRYKRNPALRWR